MTSIVVYLDFTNQNYFMLNYIIIAILLAISTTFIYKWYRQHMYNKQLFVRAWRLELILMAIYNDCSEESKEKIRYTLSSIKPL